MGFKPYAKYDPDSDAIYVYLADASVSRTVSLDDARMIDYSADGAVVGVEFLFVSAGVDLRDVPFRSAIEAAINDLNRDIKVLV